VGVAVDQSRYDQPATGVHRPGRAVLGRQLSPRPHPLDGVAFPDQGGVGKEMNLRLTAFGPAGGQLADVFEDTEDGRACRGVLSGSAKVLDWCLRGGGSAAGV